MIKEIEQAMVPSLSIIEPPGLLKDIPFIASPNCNERPEGAEISLLVIHGISLPPGEFGGPFITALFSNTLDAAHHPYFQEIANLRVSAHLLIRRNGELIQFVPFSKRAWHAGFSYFNGQENCNDFSIGIELEGTDITPYTEQQYQRLAELTRTICTAYPSVTEERIVAHSDIAPGRKTDPGAAFDWMHYRQLLAMPA